MTALSGFVGNRADCLGPGGRATRRQLPAKAHAFSDHMGTPSFATKINVFIFINIVCFGQLVVLWYGVCLAVLFVDWSYVFFV